MRLRVEYIGLLLSFLNLGSMARADVKHDNLMTPAKRVEEATGKLPFDKLSLPSESDVTPREACGIASLVLSYLELRTDQHPFCNPVSLRRACTDINSLSEKAREFLTEEQMRSFHRKIPTIINSVYECARKMKDERLNFLLHQKEFLLKKKKELIEASCETVGELLQSGKDPEGKADPTYPGVDFENPCLAVFRSGPSRTKACFRSAIDACKILTGQMELENLIPPGIYEAGIASHLPLDLPAYLQGELDGATDVLKAKIVGKLKDIVGRRIGGVAISTITAASKQIYMAAERGGNDWSECAGTGNVGACFHKIFMDGIPHSRPFHRPVEIAPGQFEERCCYCHLDLTENRGLFSRHVRTDDYLAPIENGPFEQSFCYAQEGTTQAKLLLRSAENYQIYSTFRGCRPVKVKGKSCVLGDSKNPVEIIAEAASTGKMNKEERGIPMAAAAPREQNQSSIRQKLYAAGARPNDLPRGTERFQSLFNLPESAEQWTIEPLAHLEGEFDFSKATPPNQSLRVRQKQPVTESLIAREKENGRVSLGALVPTPPQGPPTLSSATNEPVPSVVSEVLTKPAQEKAMKRARIPIRKSQLHSSSPNYSRSPGPVKKEANCSCQVEWSQWVNNYRELLCVARKNGRPLAYVRHYLEDPSCQAGCQWLEYYSGSVRTACFGGTVANPRVPRSDYYPPPMPTAIRDPGFFVSCPPGYFFRNGYCIAPQQVYWGWRGYRYYY